METEPIKTEQNQPMSPILVSKFKDADIAKGTEKTRCQSNFESVQNNFHLGGLRGMREQFELSQSSGSQNISKGMKVRITWNYGGKEVFVIGSFTNWDYLIKLPQRSVENSGHK